MGWDGNCANIPLLLPSKSSSSILVSLDLAEASGPALVGCRGDRRLRLDAGAHANGVPVQVPSLHLIDPLHRFLVEAQQERHRAIAERWVRLDRCGKAGIDLRRGLGRPVIHCPSRCTEPDVELYQRRFDSVRQQILRASGSVPRHGFSNP